MIKKIKLSDGTVVKYNTKTDQGYEEVLGFYDKKIRTLVKSWKTIPHHDEDDLAQICRMQLLNVLKNFNTGENISFSTYVYTALNRRLSQLVTKYKAKKYSVAIKDDNYVNYNYPLDRKNNCQLLRLKKDKCPIQKKPITGEMCKGCEHNLGYAMRRIEKGKEAGKLRKVTLCKFYQKVMEQRGEKPLYLEQKISKRIFSNGSSSLQNKLESVLPCVKQKRRVLEDEFYIDLKAIKEDLSEDGSKILDMIIDGMSKRQIIKSLKISQARLKKITDQLERNERLREIAGKL